ncbi:MAG: hypothetical protein B0D91_15170 [Oceanospirillales bacterium LUC14_002_19_P2]|nr:MAG: hypothetical protein B0D91_15170 [Oceanospirillales bacterium LUC14_002_19_P2]
MAVADFSFSIPFRSGYTEIEVTSGEDVMSDKKTAMSRRETAMSDQHDCGDDLLERYEVLISRFRESSQEPQDFIADCLREGAVTANDALDLMKYLKSSVDSRSFALADLSDDEHFRLGLYETNRPDSENNPIFVIQFDGKLSRYKEEIDVVLEEFARSVAEIACMDTEVLPLSIDDNQTNQEEAVQAIFDAMPTDTTCH